ncbi:hypothetical protein MMIC_P0205 [Mariprofundus micogutta]|uniref:Uncharacterized protein n=1 Tax=Mariprofundus micogutta TaxID=1921010 RepID=A0A1L8CK42_9PROT|nr:hypothetical protein MMIC_P0205 [Mariprofundus micogutta]
MKYIRDQIANEDCRYEAHVWFNNHSHQCGCFGNKKAAEHWADWLQKKIVTQDLIMGIFRPRH